MRRPFALAVTALLAACSQPPHNDTATSNAALGADVSTVPADETAASMGPNATGRGPNVAAPMSTADFVNRASMSDLFEIASGKIASAKAQDPALKKFASDMVADHSATSKQLKNLVGGVGSMELPPQVLDAEHNARLGALRAANGAAFDALYRSQQLDAHRKALAVMQGYGATGDNETLRRFAVETAPRIQMHLERLGGEQ